MYYLHNTKASYQYLFKYLVATFIEDGRKNEYINWYQMSVIIHLYRRINVQMDQQ